MDDDGDDDYVDKPAPTNPRKKRQPANNQQD